MLFLTMSLVAFHARGEEFPTSPLLRLEGGMHTAIIRRIAVDARGKVAATVSDDKTLRIWSLPEGKIIKILRVPVGLGNDGKLFAVDLSPDGRMAAVGGWTGWDWERKTTVYLFDVKTGKILRRIGRLPNTINHVAFSKNGVFLAIALARDHGIRIFRVQDGVQVVGDENYFDHTYWVDFDKNGRLISASYDGHIRLYDNYGALMAHRKFQEERQPFSAVFSPAGTEIAIGFRNAPNVEVVSATSLKTLYFPDSKGIEKKMQSVAWSRDGRFLFAGGLHQNGEFRVIRRWENAGKNDERGQGRYVDIPVSSDTIMDIDTLADGSLVYASGDPIFGRVDGQGAITFKHVRPQPDYRSMQEMFTMSDNGRTFEFTYDPDRATIGRFSMDGMLLEHNPASRNDLKPPIRHKEGLQVFGWKDKMGLVINGRKMPLKNLEKPSSYAIAPDGQTVLVGTNFHLRYYTRDGSELWEIPTPTMTWNVTITNGGRVGVAAYGDGTIRWYDLKHGKEVLAFFPHNDRKRWILWNPQGFYTASVRGDDLVGWHVNRGMDAAADFYPVGQFQARYNNPVETVRLLQALDIVK